MRTMISLTPISPPPLLCKPKSIVLLGESYVKPIRRRSVVVRAFLFNPSDDPIVKQAIKEPVAFLGGVFAGILRLDLNEDPLKEWVSRTVEASGLTEEEIDAEASQQEVPQQIEIE